MIFCSLRLRSKIACVVIVRCCENQNIELNNIWVLLLRSTCELSGVVGLSALAEIKIGRDASISFAHRSLPPLNTMVCYDGGLNVTEQTALAL